MFVAPALDQDVQHDPVLIHRPPEPVLLPCDPHGNLFEVPRVSSMRQSTADLIGDALAELEAPLPPIDLLRNPIMADCNAASGQDLVHMAQAQGEAEIEPDRIADDLGREAVTGI